MPCYNKHAICHFSRHSWLNLATTTASNSRNPHSSAISRVPSNISLLQPLRRGACTRHQRFKISDEEIESLGWNGYFARNKFVGSNNAEILTDYSKNLLPRQRKAGKIHDINESDTIRRDHIRWIDQEEEREGPLNRLIGLFEDLKDELRQQAFLPIDSFDLQLAHYEPGGFYRRHSDVPKHQQHQQSAPTRLVTCVYYLNSNYERAQGGNIRIFLPKNERSPSRNQKAHEEENGETFVEFEPELDRLVVFRSELEHEVLPTKSDRWAITAWYHKR